MFAWDAAKAAANLVKHGVSFDDAVAVFADVDALDGPDLRHSAAEARFREEARRWRSHQDHQRAEGES